MVRVDACNGYRDRVWDRVGRRMGGWAMSTCHSHNNPRNFGVPPSKREEIKSKDSRTSIYLGRFY